MLKKIHFSRPPISEALIDIKVTLPQDINIQELQKAYDVVREAYPIKEVKAEWETKFQIKPGESPVVTTNTGGQKGYMLYTSDKKKIFQVMINGFTYNQLTNYTTWNDFYSEAMKLWKIYIKVAKPLRLTRLALRYINKIELPLPIKNLSDYIKTVPSIAENIAHEKTNYFMRMLIKNTENENKAVLTNVVNQIPGGNTLPVILDIDVFREHLDIEVDTKKMEPIFQSLREYKNNLFINNITEETMKLIK